MVERKKTGLAKARKRVCKLVSPSDVYAYKFFSPVLLGQALEQFTILAMVRPALLYTPLWLIAFYNNNHISDFCKDPAH
jgi:hypothetical protein